MLQKIVLADCENSADSMVKCHYPVAYESNKKLYIIASADYAGEDLRGRGAVLFSVDLEKV